MAVALGTSPASLTLLNIGAAGMIRKSLERGEAMTLVNFQKWINGGKTLQQLVDYMVANGLRFTPATQGDEGAYRAVYTGMAQLDIALNTMFGSAPIETAEPKYAP
jgi:hypothetical protein